MVDSKRVCHLRKKSLLWLIVGHDPSRQGNDYGGSMRPLAT